MGSSQEAQGPLHPQEGCAVQVAQDKKNEVSMEICQTLL
jgi:hypothetical protein